MSVVQIEVEKLEGRPLDWAAAQAAKIQVSIEPSGTYSDASTGHKPKGTCYRVWLVSDVEPEEFAPSSDWGQGGPLIEKFGVLLSPPTSPVHRNFGSFDKRNGYYPSEVWGTTIFAQDRKYRRRGLHHQTNPLIAAMRAIVQFELGDSISVPVALVTP